MKTKNTPEGLVFYDPKTYTTVRLNREESRKLGIKKFPKDTPPEVVHLEISDRCNLNCPYCYVRGKRGRELSTAEWVRIIKDLADTGVFQVTFGGGEPTMREDLEELALYAKACKLTLCMTSNGLRIPEIKPSVLKLFDQINVSWHRQAGFVRALAYLKDCHVRRGINFVLSKQYEKDLGFIKQVSKQYGAEILFLTYKAVNQDINNQISAKQVFKEALKAFKEHLKVAVDGMTCGTCLAGKRFCDIDSLGNVMVCSFIRKPIGNLLEEPFKKIWARRNKNISCPYVRRW